MKKIVKFSFIFMLAFCVFACSNDNTDAIDDPQESTATVTSNLSTYARAAHSTNQSENIFDNDEMENGACFTINFPYTITDGETETVINSEDDLQAYIANSPVGIMLVFPFTITNADGSESTINNEMEFFEAIEDCIGSPPVGANCFTFNYPLNIMTTDGSSVTVNNDVELYSVPNGVGFEYPITVTTNNGVVTINSNEDFDNIYNECYNIEPCDDCEEANICFEIVYPITLVEENGTIVTIDSDEEFFTFIENLEEGAHFVPTYPMNIEYDNGTQETINSDEELSSAFDNCN